MKNFQLTLLVIFVFLMSGCTIDQGDRKAMIKTEVDRKLKEVQSNKLKTCYEEIVRLATLEVDSMLIEKSRLNKNQLEKPTIPTKPSAPELKTPFDDSEVKPIIE